VDTCGLNNERRNRAFETWRDYRKRTGRSPFVKVSVGAKEGLRCDGLCIDDEGRRIGVEHTRVYKDLTFTRAVNTVDPFFRKSVAPLVRPHADTKVWLRPWVITRWNLPTRVRPRLGTLIAERAVAVLGGIRSSSLSPDITVELEGNTYHFRVEKASQGRAPSVEVSGWESYFEADEQALAGVEKAIRDKALKGQLDDPFLTVGVLLLHDRIFHIRADHLAGLVGRLTTEGVLKQFDEVYVVDSTNEGNCFKRPEALSSGSD